MSTSVLRQAETTRSFVRAPVDTILMIGKDKHKVPKNCRVYGLIVRIVLDKINKFEIEDKSVCELFFRFISKALLPLLNSTLY